MNDRKFVLQQTLRLLLGQALCLAVTLAAFALLGAWDTKVLLGGIAGFLIAGGNFFFLAITACLASERAMQQDVEGGKKLLKSSQTFRFFAVGGLLVLCAASKACNLIALVLPLLLERPILMVLEFFKKKED